MNDTVKDLIGLGIVTLIITAVLWMIISSFKESVAATLMQQAVAHHAAHWEVAADGSTTFKWNEEAK